MKNEQNNNLWIIAIVAIVAVVGLVTMFGNAPEKDLSGEALKSLNTKTTSVPPPLIFEGRVIEKSDIQEYEQYSARCRGDTYVNINGVARCIDPDDERQYGFLNGLCCYIFGTGACCDAMKKDTNQTESE